MGAPAGLALEILIFSAIAQNFFSLGNFFEVIRLSVELGLLALALTPVMITGGIDLSVGSMMGSAAVVFGAAWRDWRLPFRWRQHSRWRLDWRAARSTRVLITRFDIPPIIVTLGSFSLFRGIAEGITRAAR